MSWKGASRVRFMKKIDKLILSSFLGPFIITFLVVVFILLMQHMLKYFDDIVGKGLDWDVIGSLLFYFAIFMTPVAMPLAVLLSSLMTYGNLGEHFELTAIKASGISLVRTLMPISVFVLLLTVLAFYSNNHFVPKAALEAYSLMWDIKQKKPALDLKEGAFYDGIPDFSIKINKKYPDGETIKDVIIYDHRKKDGNKEIILADSGRMSMLMGDRYLMLELYEGNNYTEGASYSTDVTGKMGKPESLSRTRFHKSKMVLDLSSFDLGSTDKELFRGNRIMRNLRQLDVDVDSIEMERSKVRYESYYNHRNYFGNFLRDSLPVPASLAGYHDHRQELIREARQIEKLKRDSIENRYKSKATREKGSKQEILAEKSDDLEMPKLALEETKKIPKSKPDSLEPEIISKKEVKPREKTSQSNLKIKERNLAQNLKRAESDSSAYQKFVEDYQSTEKHLSVALTGARQNKAKIDNNISSQLRWIEQRNTFAIQWHKILSNSAACIVMFLIGAPLGAIIKRGGLGVPVLFSIFFFIIFYVINILGEKWAKQDMVDPWLGVWAANFVLLPIGLLFLKQARNDSRLFDVDMYLVWWDRLKNWYNKRFPPKLIN